MILRQSIITVKPYIAKGVYNEAKAVDIIFRQPYHNFGLAYSFSFSKSYFAPFTTCQLSIDNIDQSIVDAFYFDTKTHKKRPIVEIRAGYSDYRLTSTDTEGGRLRSTTKADISGLKADLPLVFSGFPTYSEDNKIVGGRVFTVSLSDFDQAARAKRVSISFAKGRSVYSVLNTLFDAAGSLAHFDPIAEVALSTLKIENSLLYNNRQIIEDILPALAKQYKFYYFIDSGGVFKVRAESAESGGVFNTVKSSNGLIEHPTAKNFVQWSFKTLFGLPQIFHPGDRCRLISDHFIRTNFVEGINNPTDDTLNGLIVDGVYSFNDTNAEINYTLAADGQPISANPILKV